MPFDQYGNYINPFDSDEDKGRLAESPGLASVIGGLGAEVGIAGGAQALGAAPGVGYVPIAVAGGFLGSVVTQSINAEPCNLGRAVAASVVNLIPGTAGIKGASKAGTITKALNNAAKGLNQYGTKTIPGAIQREAFRGSALGISEITVENLINDGNLPTYDEVLKYGGFGGLIGGTLGGVLGSVQRKGLGKSLEQSAIDVTEDANKSWKTMSYQDKNDFLKQIGEDIIGDLPESELNNKFNKFVSLSRRNAISEASLKALIYSRDPVSGADVVQGNILTKMLNTVAPSTVFGKELNNQISAIQGMVDEADALGGRIRKEIKTELQKDPNSNIMEDIRRYVTSPHESGAYAQDIPGSDHLLRGSRGRFVRKAKLPDYLSRLEADLNQWKAHRTKLQTELLEFVEPKTIDGFVGKDESIALRSILDESGGDISSKQSIAESIKLQNYLTQEYQLFDDAKYFPSKDSKKALINWMVKNDESISGAEYRSDATGKILKGEDLLRAQREAAEDYINRTYLRRSANPQNRVASSPSKRKIQDEFRTSDILLNKNRSMPKELTDFLGAELKDPITGKPDVAENLFGTISKLAKRVSGLKAQEVLLRDLQQQGKLNIISIDGRATEAPFVQFQNPKEVSFFNGTIVGNAPEEVALAVNEIVDSGMVNKATSEALDSTTRFVKQFKDLYGTLAGASKAVKVIASPIAYSTNAMGGAITALASGNFNLIGSDLRKGIRMSLDEFGTMEGLAQAIGDPVSRAARKGLDAKQMQALIDDVGKMRKYGMMGADVASSDTARALGDGSMGKFVNKVFDPLSKSYQVTDNAFRYLVWKNNIDKFKRMFPKPAGMTDARYLEEIERGAAFFTNDTYQNYNKLNKSLRQFSALGVVDPFISFTAELHRNLWNNVTSIIKMSGPAKLGGGTFGKGLGFSDELLANANRKAIQEEGTKRGVILAGITAGFGMGVKAYNESNGVDSEKMEALKNTVIPDYDRAKDLIINMNPDGKSGTYINASYINPFSEFNRIFNALSSGKAPAAGIRDVASIMSDQFFGQGSFMFQSLGNALRNQDVYGRPISVSEDKFASFIDRTKFFFKELLTPGVTRELNKWVEALNGTGDYTENQLLMRLMGIRQTSFSVDDDTRYKIRPSNENMRIIKGRYNNLDENTPEDVRQRLYQKANQDRDASMNKLMTVYDSLKTLGLSDDEAIKTFKDSNVSNSDVIQIAQNKVRPIDYVKATTISDAYEAIEGSTFADTRRNILANTKGNIKVRKALLSKLRQEQTYARRNISEFDRSLLSLGASERAEMLMNVLGVGPLNSVLINEYRRKGIITDDVLKAMRLRGSLASY